MKKLLSIFAAAALVFGFASCSGDLHDSEPLKASDFFLRGNMNGFATTALTDNGDTWTVKFNATATETQFGIATSDWGTCFRMTEEGGSTCAEYTAADVAEKKEKDLYHGGGMSNATIATTVGAEYTVTIKPQAGYVTVSIEQGELPVYCYLVNADLSVTQMNITDKNKYEITKKADASGNIEFAFFDGTDSWGTTSASANTPLTLSKNKTVSITGLTANANYIVTVDNTGDAPVAKVAGYSLAGLTLKGGWEGWWSNSLLLTSDTTITFVTEVGEHPASGNEWGIFPDGEGNVWYVEDLVLGTETPMELVEAGANGNSTMEEDWEVDATYTIVLKVTSSDALNPAVTVKITKNE